MRESLIFNHWETMHCPVGTSAHVKVACPLFDTLCDGCPQMLTPQVHALKLHLMNVHCLPVDTIVSFELQSRCAKVAVHAWYGSKEWRHCQYPAVAAAYTSA